jgi:hypothetical protein
MKRPEFIVGLGSAEVACLGTARGYNVRMPFSSVRGR